MQSGRSRFSTERVDQTRSTVREPAAGQRIGGISRPCSSLVGLDEIGDPEIAEIFFP